jgi:hypothetical protein
VNASTKTALARARPNSSSTRSPPRTKLAKPAIMTAAAAVITLPVRVRPWRTAAELSAPCTHSSWMRERHARLLLTLAVAGPQTVGELDRAGFVERHEDEADRRRTIVSLPETVRGPAARLARARLEPLRRTLGQLSPTARRHFIQGLRILSREAASAEPGQIQVPNRK